MGETQPDTTQDWLLREQAKPPLVGELVQRIEEALAIARSAEAAAVSIGAAALDAAEQARRAAGLAEQASAAVLDALKRDGGDPAPAAAACQEDDRLHRFSRRADSVVARLRELERH